MLGSGVVRRTDALAAALVLALAIPGAASALEGIYVAVHTVRQGETVGSIIRIYRTTSKLLGGLNPARDGFGGHDPAGRGCHAPD